MGIGVLEVAIALWILSRSAPRWCAAVQTAVLLSMNAVELTYARDLLLWPAGLIPVNLCFLAAAWFVASVDLAPGRARVWLRRHPVAIDAHFRDCVTLTYAVPADVLRPLVPPGLELETIGNVGFVAVALVQTEALRPSGAPKGLGRDFFLAGYRVFTTFRTATGRRLRGLRILRSDTDRALMAAGGNLLTHYNYHRCRATVGAAADGVRFEIASHDHHGDVDLTIDTSRATLPAGSPFASEREARRFAGPLPFTFDYEPETDSVIAIEARRTHWTPALAAATVRTLSFFNQPPFNGCTPILAAAFHTRDIDYHWRRGVRHAL